MPAPTWTIRHAIDVIGGGEGGGCSPSSAHRLSSCWRRVIHGCQALDGSGTIVAMTHGKGAEALLA
jgi:hypothetical protein